MKVVIIGGNAGGASAAARLRRMDESAEIDIFEKTGYISYANCGLPYYVGGVIAEERKLTVQTPQRFKSRFNVNVHVHSEAVGICPGEKTVLIRDAEGGGEYKVGYDKLILATGVSPAGTEAIPAGSGRIFTIHTVEDALKMRAFIQERGPKTAIIVGGGYIGLEMAENLAGQDIRTVVVQRSGQLMKTLDKDISCLVKAYLKKQGVEVVTDAPLSRVSETDAGVSVLAGGREMQADMAVLAMGSMPNTGLAESIGLRLGDKKSVLVDETMRTSDPDIYAVGDAVQITGAAGGPRAALPFAGPANRQGRVAADNICGIPSKFSDLTGASIFKLFDMTAASTGLTERGAAAAGIDYEKVVLPSASHVSYFPGAGELTIKALFSKPEGRLLGAQIIGFEGVDKRIDVAAAAVSCGMTAAQLSGLNLAYAPPYSAAKDPMNVVGSIAENVLSGKVRQYHWDELAAAENDAGATLLDVRTDRETARGMFGGAIHIPLDELRGRAGELDKSKRIYVYCQSGLRSYIACRMLAQLGFDCLNLSGGYGFASKVINELPQTGKDIYPCGDAPQSCK